MQAPNLQFSELIDNLSVEQLQVEGLGDIAVRPRIVPFNPAFVGIFGRKQDNRNMTVFEGLLDPSAQFDTVHAGHHDIRNDQIDRLSGQYTKRFFSVGCRFNSEIGRQKIGDQQEQFFVVIDDQQRMVSACAGGGIGHRRIGLHRNEFSGPFVNFFRGIVSGIIVDLLFGISISTYG